MSNLVQVYNSHPYEPLVPVQSQPNQMVFKFNSPQHYLSYVESLHKNFKRASSNNSSDSGSLGFTQSKDLKNAYDVIREVEFNPSDVVTLESKVSQLKSPTEYSDEGYEIEIPEYLAGGDRIWVKNKHVTKPTRIIDDILIIDAVYSSMKDAERSRQIGLSILESIYNRRVVPRKVVIGFAANAVRGYSNPTHFTSVDVSFRDLHGIAKLLHPSAFRRIWFRIAEQYPDLSSGYGQPLMGSDAHTKKGYISVEHMHNIFDDKIAFDKEISKFIGERK